MTTTPVKAVCHLGTALLLAGLASAAQFPRDAGVIDVTQPPYNAHHDSGACAAEDATSAFQAAIHAAGMRTNNGAASHIVYVPDGCYTITNTLWWQTRAGQNPTSATGTAWVQLIGQSQAGATLFVPANSPNFQSTANCAPGTYYGFINGTTGCRAVIYTCSGFNPAFPPPVYCSGNDAYMNNVHDLTIRIGANNPGAIGASMLNSNSGSLRNVTIKSDDGTPLIALDLARYQNGPGAYENLTIEGFHYGILSGSYSYGVPEGGLVIQHIAMSGQATAGILNYTQPLWARDINYSGSGPAVQNFGIGRITLFTANLASSGGGASISAIQNNSSGGVAFLRAITCSGYQSCLSTNGSVTVGSTISEYTSKRVQSQYSSIGVSLDLPISETPTYTNANFSKDWQSVKASGAVGNCIKDDTAAIQAAMNSGKPVVYFPSGCYRVDAKSNPITIPASVRLVEGLGSCIAAQGNSTCNGPGGNFTNERTPFTSRTNGDTIFENFRFDKTTVGGMTYTGNGSFTLTDVFDLTHWTSNCSTCSIYLDDSAVTGESFTGGSFWCVQCNTETNGTHIDVSAATGWIFGWKTEGSALGSSCTSTACGILFAHNNATVEVLGTLFKANSGYYGTAFLIRDSNVSIANPNADSGYSPVYSEERRGQTRTLDDDLFWARGVGTALYSASTFTYQKRHHLVPAASSK